MAAEEDCPICQSSPSAKERFAAAKVAEHVKAEARHDDAHEEWVQEHAADDSLASIRDALTDR